MLHPRGLEQAAATNRMPAKAAHHKSSLTRIGRCRAVPAASSPAPAGRSRCRRRRRRRRQTGHRSQTGRTPGSCRGRVRQCCAHQRGAAAEVCGTARGPTNHHLWFGRQASAASLAWLLVGAPPPPSPARALLQSVVALAQPRKGGAVVGIGIHAVATTAAAAAVGRAHVAGQLAAVAHGRAAERGAGAKAAGASALCWSCLSCLPAGGRQLCTISTPTCTHSENA